MIDTSTDSLLETVEASVAFFQIHPGAIYLHQGESYLVKELDLNNRTAYAEPTDANYYTLTKEIEDLHIVKVLDKKKIGKVNLYLGEVEVTNHVVGFKKKAQYTDEVIGEEPLDLPPQTFATIGLWFDLPDGVESRLEETQSTRPSVSCRFSPCVTAMTLVACPRHYTRTPAGLRYSSMTPIPVALASPRRVLTSLPNYGKLH